MKSHGLPPLGKCMNRHGAAGGNAQPYPLGTPETGVGVGVVVGTTALFVLVVSLGADRGDGLKDPTSPVVRGGP
jgi:hypothetical protein